MVKSCRSLIFEALAYSENNMCTKAYRKDAGSFEMIARNDYQEGQDATAVSRFSTLETIVVELEKE